MWRKGRSENLFGSPTRTTVAATLSLANRAGAVLRDPLTTTSATVTCAAVRELLDVGFVVITDLVAVLGFEGSARGESAENENSVPIPEETTRIWTDAIDRAQAVLAGAEHAVVNIGPLSSGAAQVVVVPLVIDHRLVGTLQACVIEADLVTVQACREVARWVSGQLEFGELDRARSNATRAELRALRAQINPHFLFNALTTMASFVRTDPERARELLVQFAEFARYSFSTDDQFTTLADELRAIDTFVSIERARFGDRFDVSIRVAPEVLATPVPFLTLQPLVENALQHGLGRRSGTGQLTIVASDRGNEALVTIEDDGPGADPVRIANILMGKTEGDREHVGLANVDERLRTIYGSAYGLVVETAIGSGMRVVVRLPKYRVGVRA